MEKHKGSPTDYAKADLSQQNLPEYFAPPFDPRYISYINVTHRNVL